MERELGSWEMGDGEMGRGWGGWVVDDRSIVNIGKPVSFVILLGDSHWQDLQVNHIGNMDHPSCHINK